MLDLGTRMDAYLDGELDAAEVARLEAEVAADAVLRARLENRRGALQALRQAPRNDPPPNFGRLVQQRLRRKGRARARLSRLAIAVEIAAVATVVVILGVSSMAIMPSFDQPSAAPLRADVDPATQAWLEGFGAIESIGLRPSGPGLVVRVSLRPGRVDAFLRELPSHPAIQVARPPSADGRVELVVPPRVTP